MSKNQNNNHDVLGAYPETKQVEAFPERRYIRLTRFLTIFSIINLASVIAGSGLYYYLARNKDVTINASGWVHMYSIDPEKKQLLPSEPFQKKVSALQLVIEKTLRQYLDERYSYIWEWNGDTMNKRWGENGFVAQMSSKEVFEKFKSEAKKNEVSIQQHRLNRDVHIYSLYPAHGDLWSAYIETFDFPSNKKLCDCSDNSRNCLTCKEQNMIPGSRQRKKILLRVNFSGQKTDANPLGISNPLGIVVYAYYQAYVPVPKEGQKAETFWDLPPALRPDI